MQTKHTPSSLLKVWPNQAKVAWAQHLSRHRATCLALYSHACNGPEIRACRYALSDVAQRRMAPNSKTVAVVLGHRFQVVVEFFHA
jgi:hypothetical protein